MKWAVVAGPNSTFVYHLTLYQPMTHICVMSSHKPIRIYMGGLILGINTLYKLFCFFKLFPMVGKGLTLKLGHLTKQDTRKGPKGVRSRGIPLYSIS